MIGTTIKTKRVENNFYNLHAPDIKEDITMDANMKKKRTFGKTVIKGLESRNMSGIMHKIKKQH